MQNQNRPDADWGLEAPGHSLEKEHSKPQAVQESWNALRTLPRRGDGDPNRGEAQLDLRVGLVVAWTGVIMSWWNSQSAKP